jgi:hypothetical protein
MHGREFSRPKRIVLGGVAALCSRCGAEEFVRAKRARHPRADDLLCAACGTEHQYTDLLRQVAAKVMARSQQVISDARALRKKIVESRSKQP